jgi:hypothetical protein
VAGREVIGPPAPVATLPVVHALLDEARRKNYHSGVLGVRARPEWTGPDSFEYQYSPVRIVACISALAVREALQSRRAGGWLVVITDRSGEDLGSGILSHLLGHRLRTPDPWEAIRVKFAATGIDPALTATTDHRDIATGLLAATPAEGWPPAPGGVLTRDHALRSIAHRHLGVAGADVDARALLSWTADVAVSRRIGDLRSLAGDALTDALLTWLAGRAGAAQAPLLHLLRGGNPRDALPFGLVAAVLGGAVTEPDAAHQQVAREALVRLESRLGGQVPSTLTLQAWASESEAVVSDLLDGDGSSRQLAQSVLTSADRLLAELHASELAGRSRYVPAGLTARFRRMAKVLREVLVASPTRAGPDIDGPQVSAASAASVENAWTDVEYHRLSHTDARSPAFHAALRLVRWLATSQTTDGTMRSLLQRQTEIDAWVDAAANRAARGVDDPDLSGGLATVLQRVQSRRDAHDIAFARALVRHTADDPVAEQRHHAGVLHIEDVMPQVVIPLAAQTPLLLLVLDGMSTGVATEVVNDILNPSFEGWIEALIPGEARRAAALAALPTLTEVSRASLLCGELRTGAQDVERRGHAEMVRAHGLRGGVLFHKKPLDSSGTAAAIASDVGEAIDDVTGRPLVTCVLNTIDDALDRSDPGGTDWTTDAVKHLTPLLDRARRAGRVVVITSDHGHVVERRQGTQRSYPAISSGRSRDASQSAGDGEIAVSGRRVLLHEGRATLAVNERVRFGPLKAGYHGGASPAEAVVPVVVLVPGAVPEGVDLELAPPQEPLWWTGPLPSAESAVDVTNAGQSPAADATLPPLQPSLFDVPVMDAATVPVSPSSPLVDAVIRSPAYAAQRRLAGRVSTTDRHVTALLTALLRSTDHRASPDAAAIALAVPRALVHGAVLHAQRLLNVEGYAVLRVDSDGSTLILDEQLLREQFGVGA